MYENSPLQSLFTPITAFKKGVEVGAMSTVDVYGLVCKALDLLPSCHTHNGSLARINTLFPPPADASRANRWATSFLQLLFVVPLSLSLCFGHNMDLDYIFWKINDAVINHKDIVLIKEIRRRTLRGERDNKNNTKDTGRVSRYSA